MLTATGLGVRFGDRTLFRGVDLAVGPAETCAIVGPSGSGKSRLLRALAGLDPLQQGAVTLDGRPQPDWGGPAWRAEVAYVAQDPVVLPGSPADTAAELAAFRHRRGRVTDAAVVAEDLGVGQAWTRPWTELSGGERQRAHLALALAGAPRVLLLDEPTAALDAASVALVEAALHGHAVVWVSHDAGQIARLDARVVDLGKAA